MGWRGWLAGWVPPHWVKWYQHRLNPIWRGIYADFSGVPRRGTGYTAHALARDTADLTQALITRAQNYGSIPWDTVDEHCLLPLLIGAAYGPADLVRVLDFGGGTGMAYIHLKQATAGQQAVEYYVVENPAVCEEGGRLFENEHQIQFHAALPAEPARVDVVYVSSALQYIEDYAGLLRRLCAYEPKFLFLVKLSAGDIPTYASAQCNLPGTVVPYWFINIEEIIGLMATLGYGLAHRSAVAREYDQSNFPEAYRLRRTCNLLFRRQIPAR